MADDEVRRLGRLTALCGLTGLVAGLGAAGFFVMLEAGRACSLEYLAHYHPASPGYEKPLFDVAEEPVTPINRWVLLVLPAIGGLIGGVLVFSFAPEAEGHGTDAAIEAYHFKDGYVRTRVPFIKAIASMITIGTGGSAGREGPIAQIGSGFGSMVGRWLKLAPHEQRVLMASGMAAGIGAIFQAPLAGALFVTEVLYRDPDFEHEVLVPSFISSIVGYCAFGTIFGFHPLFLTPEYTFADVAQLGPYLILAGVAALGAAIYVWTFYGVRSLILERLRIPNHIKPALGGLFVGVIGFFLPEALGSGYGVVQMCFNDALEHLPSHATLQGLLPATMNPATMGAILLFVLAFAKILTTGLTIGSGGSGGVFGPAVVIGGALGGGTGLLCAQLFPGLDIHPGAFALVGMAGFFGGAANTPVSTIIMVSEMTGNYNLLLPAMLVCLTCYALCRRVSLYAKQLPSRLDAPTKLGNMASAILRHLTVEQALDCQPPRNLVTVPASMSMGELMGRFAVSTQACFPVVDKENRLTGVIEARDIRRIVTEVGVADLIIARDIEIPAQTVTANDSLLAVINSMVKSDLDELLVVDRNDSRKVVGTLSRSDVIACYNRQFIGVTASGNTGTL